MGEAEVNKMIIHNELELPVTHIDSIAVHMGESDLVLQYVYCHNGPTISGGFGFSGVRAFRFVADAHCNIDNAEPSSCKLIEVPDSDWVQVLGRQNMYGDDSALIRHFMSFFPDFGCYEVAAEEWHFASE